MRSSGAERRRFPHVAWSPFVKLHGLLRNGVAQGAPLLVWIIPSFSSPRLNFKSRFVRLFFLGRLRVADLSHAQRSGAFTRSADFSTPLTLVKI